MSAADRDAGAVSLPSMPEPGWVGPLLAMPVHPFADRFPMLPDHELKALADDIKAHGLHQPLVLSPEGELLDGRNRLAACQLAGVAPTTTTWGGDPVAYILGANLARRHLTQGQRALLIVLSAVSTQHSLRELGQQHHVSYGLLSHAATVREWAPDLVEAVLVGTLAFDPAYQEALARKDASQAGRDRLAELEQDAPDLAAQVRDETLTIKEAVAAYHARLEDARHARAAETSRLGNVLDVLEKPGYSAAAAYYALAGNIERGERFTAQRIRVAGERLLYLADHWETPPPKEDADGPTS